MAVNGMDAARTLLARATCTPGLCLYYVWQAYKAHGASADGSYPTAYDAWLGSPGKHHGDRNPPPGVPVYWGPKPGSRAGDVVISLGGGRVAATDWPRNGVIGETTIDARERQIGRPYLGWTDNILGYPVALAATAGGGASPFTPDTPTKSEEDTMRFIDGANIILWPNGVVNAYPANVYTTIKQFVYWPEDATWSQGRDTFIREAWAAFNTGASATAAAVAKALPAGRDIDVAELAVAVAAAMPKSFTVTVS